MKAFDLLKIKQTLGLGMAGFFILITSLNLNAQTGPNYAGAVTNDNGSGSVAWSNTSNAGGSANDDSRASASLSGGDESQYLKATDFGFSIPAGHQIDGIQVVVEWQKTGGDIQDLEVVLVSGGSVLSGGNKASNSNLPSSDDDAVYGGPNDVWSQSLSPAIVNSSGFGVAIRVKRSGGGPSAKKDALVDRISIKVYHSFDAEGGVAANTANIAVNAAAIAANSAAIAADHDGDATNELNTAAGLNAKSLEITDAGGTLSVDLQSLANEDSDGDTKIHFEKSADEDIIRFDLAGTEKWVMRGSNLSPSNSGGSIFIGENAGNKDDLSDNKNIFIGQEAGNKNVTGQKNIFIGFQAGSAITTTSRNIFIGERAGSLSSSGATNTFIGNTTGFSNTGGGYNAFYGEDAGYYNVSGSFNTFSGYRAGFNNTTGSYNTATGIHAGYNGTTWSNRTAIGYNAQNTAGDQIRLGNSSVTSIGGYANWTNVSDGQFKKNVSENVIGMDFIMKLRPVTYNLDLDAIASKLGTPEEVRLYENEAAKGAVLQSGFIAQEVEASAKELGYNFSGVDAPKNENDFYGLRYAEFVVPIVKGVQEQQADILDLQNRVTSLESGKPSETTPANTVNHPDQNENHSNTGVIEKQQRDIQELRKEIEELKKSLGKNNTGSTSIEFEYDANVGLGQNKPNPFSDETKIGYCTPKGTFSAQILIFDMNGILINTIELLEPAKGEIVINGYELKPGMYIYSLIADGREIDTKRMILTE